MTDYSHLDALEIRLSNERVRLANAKTAYEKTLRGVWVAGITQEIEHERKILGLSEIETMTDDELLAELSA